MQETKLNLSAEQISMAANAGWILTKNEIFHTLKNAMAALHEEQLKVTDSYKIRVDPVVYKTQAKISRGENYSGLPYLMLDYPRLFHQEGIFAIRTMFWWGRFFSTTLHLSGKYKILFLERIRQAYPFLVNHHFYLAVGSNEWQHDITSEDYRIIQNIPLYDFGTVITGMPFIKLALHNPIGLLNDCCAIWRQQFGWMWQLLYD